MWKRDLFFVSSLFLGLVAVITGLLQSDGLEKRLKAIPLPAREEISETVNAVDLEFEEYWQSLQLPVAGPAPLDTVRRRLSLGLAGTIPSLEELRSLEVFGGVDPVGHWVQYLLEDRRCSDYLAERYARSLVGADQGPFLVFRRRRFVSWLSDQLQVNLPYDLLVRQLIEGEGIWTDTPEVNFFTVAVDPENGGKPDPVVLTGHLSRALLGVRVDCLQCHDDRLGSVVLGSRQQPREGTQQDFHQLAAYFGQVENSVLGIRDKEELEYRYQYLDAEESGIIVPQVPFLESLTEGRGSRRQQLARWVTHRENRPFARTAVNRTWAILFGRPLVEPIDDISLQGPYPPGLELLATDFIENGFDLRRLVRVISSLRVFRMDSRTEFEVGKQHEQNWAVFPLTRLRPEQVVGSISQSASLGTINAEANFIRQLSRIIDQGGFLERFGDQGRDEFDQSSGTVAQRLLMMNGDLLNRRTMGNPLFNGSTRIAQLAENDCQAVRMAYLCVLTREPSEREMEHFHRRLQEASAAKYAEAMGDLYWTLLNSSEFSWNH
ncbi:MAG: hypothetical protein CMJ73_02340 [Planctomycetaceae bacterium]|nr:hypothetical protein [Planctomycetaceae bacterium]